MQQALRACLGQGPEQCSHIPQPAKASLSSERYHALLPSSSALLAPENPLDYSQKSELLGLCISCFQPHLFRCSSFYLPASCEPAAIKHEPFFVQLWEGKRINYELLSFRVTGVKVTVSQRVRLSEHGFNCTYQTCKTSLMPHVVMAQPTNQSGNKSCCKPLSE